MGNSYLSEFYDKYPEVDQNNSNISEFREGLGYGDYTLEKEKIFENMSLNDIVREIKEMRNRGKSEMR